jgi:hypothetical protein
MFIETICWHDRKYFTKRMSNHIYCTLRVWDIVFGIDPSLCEINIYNESWYRERAKNKKPTSLASIQEENLYREAEVFNFSSRDKVISQETDGDILPLDPRRNEKDTGLVLWMLDDTDYIALIRYVRLRGKNYPCLCLNKDYKDMIIWVLGKNKDLRINRKQTPERLKEKIEEHLLILDSITEYS